MSGHLDDLNLIELLDLLEPVPEPEPISLMPQTAGWIWLAVFLLGLIVFAARALVRRHRANAYRRAALAELQLAGDDPGRIAAILRRAALAAFPRSDVAALTGEEWVGFLNETATGNNFTSEATRALTLAPYARTAADSPDLNQLARAWVRHHRRDS